MLLPDMQEFYHMSELSNADKMVPVLRKVTTLWISGIVPSDSSALTSRVNGITQNENFDREYTGLVMV